MFRDQKNINIKVLSWLLLAIIAANAHHLCTFIFLDVLHLNREIIFEVASFKTTYYIKDVFPFYDAPNDVHLDIQYYLFLVGDRIRDCIVAYLLYSSIFALATFWHTVHRYSTIYRRIQLFTKAYLFVQIFGLVNYLLSMGQFFRGLPILIYTICVFTIFFIRWTGARLEIKAEL